MFSRSAPFAIRHAISKIGAGADSAGHAPSCHLLVWLTGGSEIHQRYFFNLVNGGSPKWLMKKGPKCHAEPFACHSERSEESLYSTLRVDSAKHLAVV